MAFYVVKDQSDKLYVVEASGFIPDGALCEAPSGATVSDGDCISVSEVDGKPVATLDQVKKTQKEALEASIKDQVKTNGEAEEFLASTDWLVIREIETGIPCPAEVKQARAEARSRIVRS